MDIKTIFKIFRYQAQRYAKIQFAAGFLFSIVIWLIMILLSKSGEYKSFGTFAAGMGFLCCSFICGIISWMGDFFDIVKMNISRKNYIAGTGLYYLSTSLVVTGIIYIIMFFETSVMKNLYNGAIQMIYEWLYGNIFNLLSITIILVGLGGMYFGAFTLKYGTGSNWWIYGIIIAIGFGATITEKYILPLINKIQPAIIIFAITAILALLCIVSVRIYMKKDI
jgi:hypothetical protein